MSDWLCLVRDDDGPFGGALCGEFALRSLNGTVRPVAWHVQERIAFAVATDAAVTPARFVRAGHLVAVGVVRLDNRRELERASVLARQGVSDLELVVRRIADRGLAGLADAVGDFAIVMWNDESQQLLAARDALGVRTLFYRASPHLLALSSRASSLANGLEFDQQYVFEIISSGIPSPGRTAFSSVAVLPPGTVLQADRALHCTTQEFWNPEQYIARSSPVSRAPVDERAYYGEFRRLLSESLSAQLSGKSDVWLKLSGGLDSSSIAVLAAELVQEGRVGAGIGGSITVVDSLGNGDERVYSEAVVASCGLRNETIHDAWAWEDDGLPPPQADQPQMMYPFYARDRRMRARVISGGGRIILTGLGPDHYLSGALYFLNDWLAAGHVGAALRELLRWAVAGKESAWQLAYRYCLYPLLPAPLRRKLRQPEARMAPWLDSRHARRFGIARDRLLNSVLEAPRGARFGRYIACQLRMLNETIDRGIYEDELELRHPFLYRPLVEFSLGLPPGLLMQPLARKWVLREAMAGILPESVRTRSGKGSITARLVWSLQKERELIAGLLKAPMLADLGCVCADRLASAVWQAQRGQIEHVSLLFQALSIESWLRARSDRWPMEASRTCGTFDAA